MRSAVIKRKSQDEHQNQITTRTFITTKTLCPLKKLNNKVKIASNKIQFKENNISFTRNDMEPVQKKLHNN